MKSEHTLSIVIPVYNRASIVERTLDSVAAQSCRDFKLVLVDNNSTDETADVLKRWSVLDGSGIETEILTEKCQGAASARDRGLGEVNTPWVMFFDSDDTMNPEHVARVIEAIRLNPKAQIIGWDVNFHFMDGRIRRVGFETRDAQYNSLFHGTTGTQRYCARTDFFRNVGGWDASVGTWDDIEVGARLLAANPAMFKIKGIPTVDIYVQADSITNREKPEHIEMLDRALNRIAATLGPGKAHWIELKRMIVAGSGGRAGSLTALHLRNEILSRTQKRRYRAMFRFAYWYTALGGRGIARILRPLM